MADVVGLDIGTRTIVGAILSGNAKKFRLVDFFIEEIPELAPSAGGAPTTETVDVESGLPASVGEVIEKALAERHLQNVDVVAAIDTKDCIVRELWVPFTRADQIERTLTFEAENSLVTFDVEEMILEYHKIGEAEGKSNLLLFAAREKLVGGRLEVLKEGGVDPVSLDLDAAALFNAFALTPTFDSERNTLLMDIGATSTKVLFIENGTLKKIRSIRLGAFLGSFNPRQIAEPAMATAEQNAIGRLIDYEVPDASSIESRFEEIENALRRLDPLGADPRVSAASAPTAVPWANEEPPSDDLAALAEDDEPIAILTDDEYDRVADDSESFEEESEFLALEGSDDNAGPEPSVTVAEAESGVKTAVADGGNGVGGEKPYEYRDFLERLGLEIQRTFATNFIRSPVEMICLTGGMSHHHETQEYFSEEFDVETISLDFGDSFETDLDDNQRHQLNSLGAVAVGLATKDLGKDRLGFDFRKDQFRYERRFEKLKFPLALAGVLLCAFFLQLVFDLVAQYQFWGQRVRDIRSKELEYYSAFWGERAEKTNSRLLAGPSARLKRDLEESIGKGGDIPIILDEIDTLREIGEVFRKADRQGIQYRLESIDLKLKTRKRTSSARGGRGNAAARSQPQLREESPSRIVLTSSDWSTGDELAKLFSNTQMWKASPSVSKKGDRVRVILQLVPEDAYLKKLDQ